MTGTGAFDFVVLGSPTVLRHTDRVTFSQPSDSSSRAGSKDSHVSPLSSPKRSPVKAAVATAVADGSESTLSIAAISSSEWFGFGAVRCKRRNLGKLHRVCSVEISLL
jgi:hypothetical protein